MWTSQFLSHYEHFCQPVVCLLTLLANRPPTDPVSWPSIHPTNTIVAWPPSLVGGRELAHNGMLRDTVNPLWL